MPDARTEHYQKLQDETVERAKKKFCLFLNGNCVANECMAWRWERTPATNHIRDGYCVITKIQIRK